MTSGVGDLAWEIVSIPSDLEMDYWTCGHEA